MINARRLFALLPACLLLIVPAAAQVPASPILPVPMRPMIDPYYRTCNQTTATGLGYSILRKGTGRRPLFEDIVVIDYIVYDAEDGMIYDEGVGTPMPVGNLIDGVMEGLQLAPKGSVLRLCIPSALGYGESGVGPIPANANLVFQFELHDVMTRSEFEARAAEADAPAQ